MKDFAPSSHADWTTMNYLRERSDRRWVEFQSSEPLEAMWKSWVAGLFLMLFMTVIVVLF